MEISPFGIDKEKKRKSYKRNFQIASFSFPRIELSNNHLIYSELFRYEYKSSQ